MIIILMQGKDFVAIMIMIILMTVIQYENICEASLEINHQSNTTQNDFLINETRKERMKQLKTPNDQILVVRLPSNTLLKYNSYKDVSILHFQIPSETRRAMFTFKAIEESNSAFHLKCKPRNVSLHLKANSYPVISPENITFPKNFLNVDQRFKIYNLQFQSNDVQYRITIDGPQVGNWFAVAFVSWTDPSNDRIEQQGLATSCDTLLLAEMSVSQFHPIIINNGQVHNSNLTSNKEEQNVTTSANGKNNIKSRRQAVENLSYNSHQQDNKHLNAIYHSNNLGLHEVFRNETTMEAAIHKQNSITQITLSNLNTQSLNVSSYSSYTSSSTSNSNNINTNSSCIENTNNEIIYKFYVPPDIGVATARITFDHVCLQCPDVSFNVQSNAFPSFTLEDKESHESNYMQSTIIKPNQTGEISIEFYVQPMTWHYALLQFVNQRVLNNTESFAGECNKTITWYHLPFVLQIDYHEPLDTKQGSLINENSHKNQTTKTDSKYLENSASVTNKHKESAKVWDPKQFRGMEFYPVIRQTYRDFFMFDYDLVPDENGTVPRLLNLTADIPGGFAFEVGEVYDIGGTLSFAVSMTHTEKPSSSETAKKMPFTPSTSERSGILAEKLIGSRDMGTSNGNEMRNDKKKFGSKNLPRSNQTIIVCMHLGEPGEPTWPDKCRYGQRLLPASSIVNNTDSNTSTGLVHVPFPESGRWYVTMGLYCHGAETASRATIINSLKDFVREYAYMLENMRQPCACATNFPRYRECINTSDCLVAMNETETLKIKECLMDSKCTSNHLEMAQKFEIHHKFATEQHFAVDNCSTSVVFTISSSPCVAGRCGRYGRCYHYMSGGFVFSTCVCMKGYRGWDCTENTQVASSISILTASLLLILSNFLFLPSIYVAWRREFYTEAVIYFFAMFFSIFYHACDSGEEEYSFCLVKIGVLQFCDFYCGLLAIWVTLIAMSHIREQFVSLLHMFGAILLAFGTELNKQSLWIFLAPALTGICLISASWGVRCYKSRKWFPACRYLTVYMPLGTVLVMVGLVCYAFLQTKQNYHIVHSIWHMVMALSILCLLPSRKSFIPKC